MEWYIMNANGLNGLDVHLGMHVGDAYIVDDDCLETLELLIHKLRKDDPVNCPVRHYVLASRLLTTHIKHILKYCVGRLDLVSHCVKLMLELSCPLDPYEQASATAHRIEMHAQLATEIRALLCDGMAADFFGEVSDFVRQVGQLHISEPCLELLKSLLRLILNTLVTCPASELEAFGSKLLTQGLDELLFYATSSSQRARLVVPAVGIMWFVYGNFEWQGGPVALREAPATADDRRKRLIVRMLEHGLGKTISTLQEIMLEQQSQLKVLDEKYYFWLIAYFLRHNQQVHVPLHCLREILSTECLGYLVYKSVENWERLMTTRCPVASGSLSSKQGQNSVGSTEKQTLQVRLGLAVSALTSILRVVKEFGEMRLDDESVVYLTGLIGHIVAMKDLREMLLLFVRCFSSSMMPLTFLVAVVRLNHRLLTLAESFMECYGSSQPQFDMLHHISQFASPRIMHIYSSLATRFSSNDSELNDGVFTMMDHVARDVGRVDTLLQSEAIGTFMRLNPANALPENCELAEYVLQTFLNRMQSSPSSCMRVCTELLLGSRSRQVAHRQQPDQRPSVADAEEQAGEMAAMCVTSSGRNSPSWSEQERDDLFELYFKLKGDASAMAGAGDSKAAGGAANRSAAEFERVAEALEQRGHARRSADDVASQLLADGLLDSSDDETPSPQAIDLSVRGGMSSWRLPSDAEDVVEACTRALRVTPDGSELLSWLAKQLADVAYAKQLTTDGAYSPCSAAVRGQQKPPLSRAAGLAAIAFFSVRCNVDTPLVTYSESQESAVCQHDGHFRRLLVALGFRMPSEGLLFPRIPASWSTGEVLCKRRVLGVAATSRQTSRTGSPVMGAAIGDVSSDRQSPEQSPRRTGRSGSDSKEHHDLMDFGQRDCGPTSSISSAVHPAWPSGSGSTTADPAATAAPNLWLLYMQPGSRLCK